MVEFTYNNVKNASTRYTPFELNYGYYSRVSYKKDINPCSMSKSANKLANELKKLMATCRNNLNHAPNLQKQAHEKAVKHRSYAPGNKVWSNSKYIQTKRNQKLEAKFFRPFWVLHLIGKQTYKLKLPKI